ncbi:lasso peptide biosynthesis B2 protein [Novosphingobium sp. TH158]|uniref:lasso peptide biosynthesis B2 protein n=1 Tax=Novosphingobium sp. TH158 TaxID=2067455 RepID=UPI0021104B99|nr:lasso peptide biosynthesis B2 protein [Novosphingobium sp. TH158]
MQSWPSSRGPASLATVPEKRRRGPVRSRLETLEAALFLTMARLLIGAVRFERWRKWLGDPAQQACREQPQWIDAYCAKVVMRAVSHLPFDCACLPQAMALHWMLRRRGRAADLVIATLGAPQRGTHDDLHAWVEKGGQMLIGMTTDPLHPVIRLRFPEFEQAASAVQQ